MSLSEALILVMCSVGAIVLVGITLDNYMDILEIRADARRQKEALQRDDLQFYWDRVHKLSAGGRK
jgi:hypothetical protein